jgi:hypothetical protein
LAGSLKRELKSKYGVQPKMTFAHGELEVLVNGSSVFSYKRIHEMPTLEGLMETIEAASR